MAKRTAAPNVASRWRRKRRNASRHSESAFVARAWGSGLTSRSVGVTVAIGLAEGDPWVEPAVQEVGDQVEQHYQAGEDEGDCHDDRRVVGEDGADQQRPDARH